MPSQPVEASWPHGSRGVVLVRRSDLQQRLLGVFLGDEAAGGRLQHFLFGGEGKVHFSPLENAMIWFAGKGARLCAPTFFSLDLAEGAGAFSDLASDADAAGHDDLLDIGGASGMDGHDAGAGVGLHVAFGGAEFRVVG